MFCASIIKTASLYVLAAVKTSSPSNDHSNGVVPPISISETPADPPLCCTCVSIAAVSVIGLRATSSFRARKSCGVARGLAIEGITSVRERLLALLGPAACTSFPGGARAMWARTDAATAIDADRPSRLGRDALST